MGVVVVVEEEEGVGGGVVVVGRGVGVAGAEGGRQGGQMARGKQGMH